MKTFILVVILLGGFTAWSQQADLLIFREKIYDFGELVEANGAAEHEFVFTNNSGRPVRIVSVEASCGCTTPGWSQTIIPQGKTGFVKASFDPRGRPGYFNKSLTIKTDPDLNPIILEIKGQVLNGSDELDDYPVAIGHLYFKARSFNLGKIFINRPLIQKQFSVINKDTATIRFISVSKPSYLKIEMPGQLKPGQKGIIKIGYDVNKKSLFGFVSENIQIMTDDRENELKSFSVYASLEEFYSVPTGEEATQAPVLSLKEQSLDLGRTKQNASLEQNVVVRNSGKKDLLIKAIQGNCSCISADVDKKILAGGDSAMVKIVFRPQNRDGTQQKAITIYSNDPRTPVQRINVLAYVEE